MKWSQFLFSWQLNSHPYLEASPEVLSYRAAETLGDLQSISRGLDPGVKCKIHTIPILMGQMRILRSYVSSMMLRPKSLEIQNVMTVKRPQP
jgi:hypothetical protein